MFQKSGQYNQVKFTTFQKSQDWKYLYVHCAKFRWHFYDKTRDYSHNIKKSFISLQVNI